MLSQAFVTTPGQTYLAAFTFGNYSPSGLARTQQVIASAINTSNSALLNSVTANDSVTGTQTTFPALMGTSYSFFFTATGTQTTLQFADQPASQTTFSDGLLDNVSVVAVPESGTLALLLPALGVVGAVVLRRKK